MDFMNRMILKYALLHALSAAGYIALVAVFMDTTSRLFGPKMGHLGAVLFLLVFVISAAVTGMLVFARPIIWYLRGAQEEGVALALATIGGLMLIALLIFFALFLVF